MSRARQSALWMARPYLPLLCSSTWKITAVDSPNNRTPFIAVIGPSGCHPLLRYIAVHDRGRT